MSSLATVNLFDTKSTKYGSVEVKKIMHGEERLWPIFPFVLKSNNVYYNVTGI